MTVQSLELGFVSSTGMLVDFYATVLEVAELEPREFPMGTVRRLACGPGVLKVMIPKDPPNAPVPTTSFWDLAGIRYAAIWVDDIEAVVEKWRANGGSVLMQPFEARPGTLLAMVTDPDGNTVELMHATS